MGTASTGPSRRRRHRPPDADRRRRTNTFAPAAAAVAAAAAARPAAAARLSSLHPFQDTKRGKHPPDGKKISGRTRWPPDHHRSEEPISVEEANRNQVLSLQQSYADFLWGRRRPSWATFPGPAGHARRRGQYQPWPLPVGRHVGAASGSGRAALGILSLWRN
jgi:hypothetical protein